MAAPLEIFRSLTPTGDWTFGAGRQNYATLDAAIGLDIQTFLYLFLGEVPWDLSAGIDWWNLIGSRDETDIILQTRSAITQRQGVQGVTSADVFLNRSTRQLSLQYAINTIFSRGQTVAVNLPLP